MIKPPISKTKAFLFALVYALVFTCVMVLGTSIGIGIVMGIGYLTTYHPIIFAEIVVSIIFVYVLICIARNIYKEDQRRFDKDIKDSVKEQCKEENL